MTDLDIDEVRQAILETPGHLLIRGGPGSGKTTIALVRASRELPALADEQRVLFLSFSRAAVRQILDRGRGLLTRSDLRRLEVRTFHAFFLDVIRSHGRRLAGRPPTFLTPDREWRRRSDFEGDWPTEVNRMMTDEAVFTFDTFAPTVARLLQHSPTLRQLLSDRYPLVIVDEFQDTNDHQSAAVRALAEHSQLIFLADPDQRIYDHIPGVSPTRLTELETDLTPTPFDLGHDNHRSPQGGILEYANAVLLNAPADPPDSVRTLTYRYDCADTCHAATVRVREYLTAQLGHAPTIAVLAADNQTIASLSRDLGAERPFNGALLPAIDHHLAWDSDQVAGAAPTVASLLAWPRRDRTDEVSRTLTHAADYFRIKYAKGTAGARQVVSKLERAVEALAEGRVPRAAAATMLLQRWEEGLPLTGRPFIDWRLALSTLSGQPDLAEIARFARLLPLNAPDDRMAVLLRGAWDGEQVYTDAPEVLRVAIAEDLLTGSDALAASTHLMTMHKSKGKEFDAVVIVEGRHRARLLRPDSATEADGRARRLLRVALTRARLLVVLVRPGDALPLTPPPAN